MEVRLSMHPHDLLVGLGIPSKAKSATAEDIPPPPEVVTTILAASSPPARVTRAASKKGKYFQISLFLSFESFIRFPYTCVLWCRVSARRIPQES